MLGKTQTVVHHHQQNDTTVTASIVDDELQQPVCRKSVKSHISGNYGAILNQRRKITKSLLTCVVIYFISYTPMQILFALELAKVQVAFSAPLTLALTAMTYASAAINPIIYTIYLPKFREQAALVFHCGKV